MTAPAYLTRLRISRAPSARALIQFMLPRDGAARVASSHRLLWTLFGDDAERRRDFLWREEGEGQFLLLSRRPPEDHHRLFEMQPPKPFAPALTAGDRLRFALRVNATVRRNGDPHRRDVVMDAIHALPPGERAVARRAAEQTASRAWLDRQGMAHGFAVREAACLGYATPSIPHRGGDMQLGVLDLEGVIEVTDPVRLMPKLLDGFGRARAFGHGLMLIAPA